MFRLWCEWDFGQDYIVFTTEAKAKAWLEDQVFNDESLRENFRHNEAIFDAGLAGVYSLQVI